MVIFGSPHFSDRFNLIDLQGFAKARGVIDVACLMVLGMEPEFRRDSKLNS